MRLHRAASAALLAFAATTAHAQQSARFEPAKDEKVVPVGSGVIGTIEGTVSGAEGLSGRWTVAVEGDGQKWQVLPDAKGRFKLKVPVGVYRARVRTNSGEADKRVEFPPILVQANKVTRIEVDPTYEHVYCTPSGERVLPVVSSHGEDENRRGLRKPTYDVHRLPNSDSFPLYLVVQSCGKAREGRLIKYKAALFSYSDFDATVISADSATFDSQNFRLTGRGVDFLRRGARSHAPRISAKVSGRSVSIDSTPRDVSSVKARGRQ